MVRQSTNHPTNPIWQLNLWTSISKKKLTFNNKQPVVVLWNVLLFDLLHIFESTRDSVWLAATKSVHFFYLLLSCKWRKNWSAFRHELCVYVCVNYLRKWFFFLEILFVWIGHRCRRCQCRCIPFAKQPIQLSTTKPKL